MAKRADSHYEPGRRSRNWLKIKTQGRQELVIAGYSKGQGRRSGAFGALVLGVYEDGVLRWAGNVGTGFDDAEIARLLAKLKPLRRETSPFAEVPKMPKVRKGDVVWVEPELVAEIRSPSGRTTAGCGRRCIRGCARTRRRTRCNASDRRSSPSSGRASGS